MLFDRKSICPRCGSELRPGLKACPACSVGKESLSVGTPEKPEGISGLLAKHREKKKRRQWKEAFCQMLKLEANRLGTEVDALRREFDPAMSAHRRQVFEDRLKNTVDQLTERRKLLKMHHIDEAVPEYDLFLKEALIQLNRISQEFRAASTQPRKSDTAVNASEALPGVPEDAFRGGEASGEESRLRHDAQRRQIHRDIEARLRDERRLLAMHEAMEAAAHKEGDETDLKANPKKADPSENARLEAMRRAMEEAARRKAEARLPKISDPEPILFPEDGLQETGLDEAAVREAMTEAALKDAETKAAEEERLLEAKLKAMAESDRRKAEGKAAEEERRLEAEFKDADAPPEKDESAFEPTLGEDSSSDEDSETE